MAIPTLPNYSGFTFDFAVEHPNWYIGVYHWGGDGNATGEYKIVTFDKDTLTEQSQYTHSYGAEGYSYSDYHKPYGAIVDNDSVLWISHGGRGTESYSIDANTGAISVIMILRDGVGSSSQDHFHVSMTDTYLVVPCHANGVRIYQRSGTGIVNTTPTFTHDADMASGSNWKYSFINHESNLLYARNTGNGDELFLDLSTFDVLTRSYGGDASTGYMLPADDTNYNWQPKLVWTRSSIVGFNYINTNQTLETIENYIPGSPAYPLEEKIYNTGNIIAWWDFDTDSQTIQLDRSGNKKDLSVSGGNERIPSIIHGKAECTRFHPAGSANALNSFYNSQQTIECWLKTESVDENENWLFQSDTSTSGNAYGFKLSNGNLVVYVHTGNTISDTRVIIKPNTIYHFVFVRDGSIWTIYVNGTKADTVTSTMTPQSGYDYTWFHKYSDNNSDTNDNYIVFDTTVYYDKALTTQEVHEHYISGANVELTPSTKNHVQAILADSPLALWQLNEQTGDIAFDYSGNGNHAGYYNVDQPLLGEAPPQYPYTEVADFTTGFTNEARAENHGMDQTFWNTAGSLECWFRVDQLLDTWGRIISIGYEGTQQAILFARNSSGNDISFSVYSGDNVPIFTPTNGVWYHLVMTKSGSNLNVYINGELKASSNTFDTTISLNRILIGDGYNDSQPSQAERLDNHLSNLALYDYVLTEQQIKTHYYASFETNDYINSVLNKNPLAFYPCYDPVGSTKLLDITGNENHITHGGALLEQVGVDSNFCVFIDNEQPESVNFVPANSQQLTIEFWLNVADASSSNIYKTFFAIINTTSNQLQLWYDTNDSSIHLGYQDGTTWISPDANTYTELPTQKWVHVCATVDFSAGVRTIFIDGKRVAQSFAAISTTLSELSKLVIGKSTTSALYPVNSKYQYLAVYDTILTDQEIEDHYNIITQLSIPRTDDLSYLITQDNPVCYWKLNETTGTTIVDTMGRVNGTIVNGSADTMSSIGLNLSDPSETALQFNGTDQYIQLEQSILPFLSTKELTIEALIWIDSLDGVNRKITTCTEVGGFNIAINTSDEIYSSLYHAVDGYLPPTGYQVNATQLYHVAMVFDGISKKIYINGILVVTDSASTSDVIRFTQSAKFVIGAEWNPSTYTDFWKGKIAHVALYDKTLTPEAIKNRYLAATGHSPLSKDDYWTFLEARNPKLFYPLSDNGNISGLFADVVCGDSNVTSLNSNYQSTDFQKESITSNLLPSTLADGSNDVFDKSFLKTTCSVEAWVQWGQHSATEAIISTWISGESVATNIFFYLQILTDGTLKIGHEYGSGVDQFYTTTFTLTLGQNQHICVTRDSVTKEYKIYLDGVFMESYSYSTNTDSTHNYMTTSIAVSKISHLVMYDRVLTDQEILDSYKAGKLVQTIPQEIVSIPFDEIPAKETYTNTSGTANGTQTLVDDQKGNATSATEFGSDGYTVMPNEATTDRLNPSASWTVSIWIKPTGSGGTYRPIFRNETYNTESFWVGIYSNTGIRVEMNGGGNTATGIIQLDVWQKLTLSFDSLASSLSVYVNGEKKHTFASISADAVAGDDLYFGHYSGGYFVGSLSDFKWYDYAMTDEQVKDSYEFEDQSKYRVYGNVTQDDLPVERIVRIYDRQTGELVKETTSPNGQFDSRWNLLPSGKEFYIVVLDDEVSPDLDPIVRDRIKPEIV